MPVIEQALENQVRMLDLGLFESSGGTILLAATVGKVIVKNQNGAILQHGAIKFRAGMPKSQSI